MANTDGSVVFGIEFDLGGIKKGMENAARNIEKSFTKPVKEAASKANGDIENILSNTQKSMKAKAASIAAVYKKQGLDSSEAFKKAWDQIERQSGTSASKVKKSINGIGGQSSKTASTMLGAFAKPLKKLATAAVGTFAVKKLVDFGKSCIDLGSDLEEVQNMVDVTFSNMSAKVDNFAKKAAGQFGLSETMAKKYTGTFGAMAKAFGFNEKAAYDMSTALTGLAGDVASFYNISQDEAYTKLKSVFTGETETLKDLGVVMTQNALDAYAMANGYGKTTSAMSEAEKVALRYAFVQDKLTTAAGDFARTSGSWANQVKILSLQFESFKATIGQGLINVFTPVIRVVNILIGRLLTLANAFKLFTGYFSGGGGSKTEKSTKKISNNAKQISKNFSSAQGAATRMGAAGSKAANKVGKAAEKASKKVRSLMGFDQINKLSDDSKSSGSSTDSGGGGSSSGIGSGSVPVDDFDTGSTGDVETIGKLPKLYENLAKAIDRFKKACSGLGGVLSGALKWGYENVLKPLGKWTISKLVPKVLDVFSGALRVVTEVCKALAPIGQKLWDVFFKPLAKFAGDTIIKFLDFLQKGLNGLADWIGKHQSLVGKITGVLLTFFAAFKAAKFIDNALSAVRVFQKGIIGFDTMMQGIFGAKSIIVKASRPVAALAKAFLGLPAPVKIAVGVMATVVAAGILVYKNWDKIRKVVGPIWNKITGTVSKAVNKLIKFLKKVVSFIKNNWKDLLLLLVNPFAGGFKLLYKHNKAFQKSIDKLIKGVAKKITNFGKNVQKQFQKTVKNVKDAVKSCKEIPKILKDIFKEKIEGVEEWFSGIRDGFINTLENLKDAVPDMSEVKDAILKKIGEFGEMTLEFGAKIITSFKELVSGFLNKVINFGASIATTLKELIKGFVGKVIDFGGNIATSLSDLVKNFTGKVIEFAGKITTSLSDLVAKFKGKAIEFIAKLSSWKDSLSNKIIGFKAKMSSWSDSLSNKIISFKAKISSFTNAIKSKILSGFKAKITSFTNAIKTGSRVLSGFKAKITSWIDNVKNKFTKKKDGGIYKNGRWSSIQQYASGGTPNQGQMFVAREAGPELVGTLGGHTAVMNNDQIVASVSSGVAKAVSAAMGRVGQSLYNAVSNLKIESKQPQIKAVTPPPLALANTQSTTDDKKMIDLLTAISNENKANLELIRQFMALVAGLDLDVKLNGKSIKDDVVKRINNNTRATGKCEIIM